MARRVNFLHYLMGLNKSELLSKFFQAQVDFPAKNDWINTVKANLNELNISMEDIRKKSELLFKKELKEKIKIAAFNYLKNIAINKEHSKMDNLLKTYQCLKMQPYLYSAQITKTEGQELFRFRTRMALFGNNFRNGLNTVECPLCKKANSVDSEGHSLTCETIIDKIPEINMKVIRVDNLYSENVYIMKETINIFLQIMKIRNGKIPKIQNSS